MPSTSATKSVTERSDQDITSLWKSAASFHFKIERKQLISGYGVGLKKPPQIVSEL